MLLLLREAVRNAVCNHLGRRVPDDHRAKFMRVDSAELLDCEFRCSGSMGLRSSVRHTAEFADTQPACFDRRRSRSLSSAQIITVGLCADSAASHTSLAVR